MGECDTGSRDERTEHLQETWAVSCDAWFVAPDADAPLLCLQPQLQSCCSSDCAQQPLPRLAQDCALFSITACNPLGRPVTPAANSDANQRLLQKLLPLVAAPLPSSGPPAQAVWAGCGFSIDDGGGYREDGFVVAFNREVAASARRAVLDLACEFQQGAIYEYEYRPEEAGLVRRTVPALIPGTESEQLLVRVVPPQRLPAACGRVPDSEKLLPVSRMSAPRD